MGNTLKVVGVAAALAVAMTPSASARYYAYGTLQAYEGTRLVAEGKGSHGVDFGKDAIGGHIGSRALEAVRPVGEFGISTLVAAFPRGTTETGVTTTPRLG